MRYRLDNMQLDHFISEHPQGPSLMSLRDLTTIQGYQMGFFFPSHFSTMGIGDRFTRESCFQTFFNKSFSDKLDLLSRDIICLGNFIIEPATCHVCSEENIGI